MPIYKGALLPHEIETLSKALDDICVAHAIPSDSPRRTVIAEQLIAAFEAGDEEFDALVSRLSAPDRAA